MKAQKSLFLLVWLLSSAEIFAHGKNIQTWATSSGAAGSVGVEQQCNEKRSNKMWKGKAYQQCVAENEALLVRGGHGGGSSHSHGHFETGLPLYAVKLLLQLGLTSLNVASWLIPMKLPQFTENKLAVSLANAFSGGVFLSLAFGHLLPDAVDAFHGQSGVPESLPYFLALTGYMMIFFVEKIAFDAHSLMHLDEDGGHGHSHGHHGHAHAHAPALTAPTNGGGGGGAAAAAAGVPPGGHAAAKPAGAGAAAAANTSGRSATVLLLALSVHSLFETMAMGLTDSALEATLLAVSIGLHQPAESLALLVSFLKSGLPKQQVVALLTLFSCVGPLGLTTGLVLKMVASKAVGAVMVALAAGTFIYVGATEVIAEEFEDSENKWKKFGSLMAGIVIIAAVTSYTEGFHDHSHDHAH